MNEIVYLSLGSNMGDSLGKLLQAILELNKKGLKIVDVSGVYLSEPVGLADQPDFLNMVITIETSASPEQVLALCQKTENKLGRVRTLRWGPRLIDIDILLFGTRTINSEELVIPHPRLGERAFVLTPLKEIAPEVFATLAAEIPSQKLVLQITKADVKIKLRKYGLTI